MEIGVAKKFFCDTHALHEQPDVDRICHADAAMHLHGFLHGECRGLAGPRFGDGNERRRLIRGLIELLQRLQNRRAGDLDLAIEMRSTMLKRLKLADGTAKLLALFQIGNSASERFLAAADELRRDRTAPDVEHPFKDLPAAIDLAEHGVGVDLHVLECEPRRVVAVDHDRALDIKALRLWIDKEQRQAIALTGRAGGACRDDQQILDIAETKAAMLLRHEHPRESHLREFFPEIARETERISRVAQLAQMRDRRFVRNKIARTLL